MLPAPVDLGDLELSQGVGGLGPPMVQPAQGGQRAKKETARIFLKPWASAGPPVGGKHLML